MIWWLVWALWLASVIVLVVGPAKVWRLLR